MATRIAGVLALAVLVPGCIDIPDNSKDMLVAFSAILIVQTLVESILIVLILFYFLPFTRPMRVKKPKRRK